MRHFILVVGCLGCLTACATGIHPGDDGTEDSGVFIVKDAGKPDTHTEDAFQPADTGVVEDTGPVDSGSCSSCDLSDQNACNGSVCGWDSMMSTSKCGYSLGQGQQGAACNQTTACAQGYVCVTPANKCMHWCKLPNGACPNGTSCKGMLQMPPMVCGVTYAICQ